MLGSIVIAEDEALVGLGTGFVKLLVQGPASVAGDVDAHLKTVEDQHLADLHPGLVTMRRRHQLYCSVEICEPRPAAISAEREQRLVSRPVEPEHDDPSVRGWHVDRGQAER